MPWGRVTAPAMSLLLGPKANENSGSQIRQVPAPCLHTP